MAQVHRFHDCVAVYVGDGSTTYLTPKDARKLAAQLNKCATDVYRHKYLDGKFGSVDIPVSDTGHNGTGYSQIRKEKYRA